LRKDRSVIDDLPAVKLFFLFDFALPVEDRPAV
jgi:hypothetical protein